MEKIRRITFGIMLAAVVCAAAACGRNDTNGSTTGQSSGRGSLPRLPEAGPQRRYQGPRPQALTFPPAKAGQTERAAASSGIWWMM